MIGSLGVPEIIFIVVLALLIFGPRRLPEIGRTIGKGLAEFRRASNEVKRTINAELALEEDAEPSILSRRSLAPTPPVAPIVKPRTPPSGVEPRGAEAEEPADDAADLAVATAVDAEAEPESSPVAAEPR